MDTTICHNCGTESPATTRFCPSCGLNLGQEPQIRLPATPAPSIDEEEQDNLLSVTRPVMQDSASTLDIPLSPWRLHVDAIFCEGRYVVERPLDRLSGREEHRVFLGHDTSSTGHLVVCEDVGAAPTTIQFVSSIAKETPAITLEDGTRERDELLLGPRLGDRRKQFLALSHARFSSILDLLVVGERLIMVRSFVEGRTLQDLLDAESDAPFAEIDVLHWAEAVLDILIYLHGQQPPIIHGDIKPSHLVLDDENNLHLVGLGCLGVATAGRTSGRSNGMEPPSGTAGYAPPEQYDGAEDPSWDLYALGVTMHYLLTQRNPANFKRPGEQWTYPPPRWINQDLSERAEALIVRALDVDPHKRYRDAVTMRDDVIAARSEQRTGRRWPWSRR